jgi:class 3 adenylate cyclase/HAMP domain-containing protein
LTSPRRQSGDRRAGDRIGLRGRLLLAFLGISAFAVTIASQQLSRQAEKIVAFAPSLLSVKTAGEHERITRRIGDELTLLDGQLAQLTDLDIDPASLQPISNLVVLLGINLITVDTMVFNQLTLVERRNELLRELSFTDLSARRLLAPGLLVMDAKLAEVRELLEQDDGIDSAPLIKLGELAKPIISHVPIQAAQTQLFVINDALQKAAIADTPQALDVIRFPLGRALDGLAELLGDIDSELSDRLAIRLQEYRRLAEGKDSIVRIRRLELEKLSLIQTLLEQNKKISGQLTASVDLLVGEANRDIEQATSDALSVQQTSTSIMILVALASVTSAALIVGLYVGGSLIRRLSGLSNSMMSIAGGNLEAGIPVGGGDEISRMADALVVFRDTARELRESNLREIEAARQRLSDAIESIDEAFSLYDADDRLVLCNSRYRQIFPEVADIMQPGTPFRDILERAAGSGLIEDASEAWIEKRMQQFRDKNGAHLQHLSDGRCLQIDESPTRDGGTVAVYSDITKLMQQARKLERWNRDLEQRVADQVRELHNIEQLKRYFPPQLTDAIVSGDEASVLEDHRREVTVLFCDLRGYTAFSSMAEPEEEMRVLREYHAVVCPLIFEYGGTLEHFAGDGVMAFVNDPIPYPDHAERAIKMAIAMREGMNRLREDWRRRNIELGFGVGIGTGFATLGRIGSPQQFHYAAIGSVANMAARLCDEAKHDQILISRNVFSVVENTFRIEAMGELSLKGFQRPIATYNVAGYC